MFLCYHSLFSVLRPYERLGLQVSTVHSSPPPSFLYMSVHITSELLFVYSLSKERKGALNVYYLDVYYTLWCARACTQETTAKVSQQQYIVVCTCHVL